MKKKRLLENLNKLENLWLFLTFLFFQLLDPPDPVDVPHPHTLSSLILPLWPDHAVFSGVCNKNKLLTYLDPDE